MKIQQKEILRYLGYGGKPADPAVLERIDAIKKELEACLTPKSVYGKWSCEVNADGTVAIGNLIIKSRTLADHIKDCEYVILLAATLGAETDTRIRRYSVTNIGKAAITQAVCAAMIESYCDDLECRIAGEQEGLYLKSRFSPGYGDFSITHQKDILNFLECGKRIGITLTDNFMMIPEKSVTAVIGLSKKQDGHKGKCGDCGNLQCEFRKEQEYDF